MINLQEHFRLRNHLVFSLANNIYEKHIKCVLCMCFMTTLLLRLIDEFIERVKNGALLFKVDILHLFTHQNFSI